MKTYNIVSYGSLREGMYNFRKMQTLYGIDAIKKIGASTLSGYKLYYAKTGYPQIWKTKDDIQIYIDVLKVSKKCFEEIEYMETSSGYKQINVDINSMPCIMFVPTKKPSKNWKPCKETDIFDVIKNNEPIGIQMKIIVMPLTSQPALRPCPTATAISPQTAGQRRIIANLKKQIGDTRQAKPDGRTADDLTES